MMKKILLLVMLVVGSFCSTAYASDFIDTSNADKQIGIGVRFGINSSSLTNNFRSVYPSVNKCLTEWGTGFETGLVVNLNIKNFFTIQPGFLFQNKSLDYTLINSDASNGTLANMFAHSRYYYFQVPILASFRFNLGDDLKLLAEAGPYFGFGLGGDTKYEQISTVIGEGKSELRYLNYKRNFFGKSDGVTVSHNKFDWGFKFGVGVLFREHYSFTIYYNAGCKNIANNSVFSVNPVNKTKEWSFTLGYDF